MDRRHPEAASAAGSRPARLRRRTDHPPGGGPALQGRPLRARNRRGDARDHCLQAATAAIEAGRDEEYVVVALLHDVGFTLCPTNHGAFAAALLGPCVSDANRWLLEHHQVFLAHHCRDHPDDAFDRHARERWRGHPHFAATAEFVARFDQATIVPGRPEAPLAVFAPMVRRVFARPPRRLPPRAE